MKWWLAALVLLGAPACKKAGGPESAARAGVEDPTAAADTVLDRYIEVSGGLDAMKAIQNIRVEAVSQMASTGISMSMVVYQQRPDRARTEVRVPGIGTILSGNADGIGWEINPMMGPRILTGKEAEDRARRNRIDLFEDYRTHYPERTLVGTVDFAGTPCSQVDTVTSTGSKESLFFAVETGLWMGSRATVVMQGGEVEMTNLVEAYEEVDGTLMPTLTRQDMGGMEIVTRFVKLETNLEDFPDLTPPAEILELHEEM